MNQQKDRFGWYFTGNDGTFVLENSDISSYLYFPLANDAGMMSSITPTLGGDIKSSQNTFLMTPVSPEDLHNSKNTRNFWIWTQQYGAWSATGNSAAQVAEKFRCNRDETVKLEAGFLWHKVTRTNYTLNIKSEVINFVPSSADKTELMMVKITNTGNSTLEFTPTAAIPIFGRSADNLRDHRHVTSLLHRIYTQPNGVQVCPVLTFDERGHKPNSISYSVLGTEADGEKPLGVFPTVEEFIGEGGSLDWPKVVVENLEGYIKENSVIEGYEAIGALRFSKRILNPGESAVYIIVMAICDHKEDAQRLINEYGTEESFRKHMERNVDHWKNKLDKLSFSLGDTNYNQWLKWVTVQPILRRIYGCSFLPHHDYGRGGRGWRDLWQDCLALLLMEPANVRELLLGNFAGVRIDGSNATIIGTGQGEFVADRNNITRVWMDHGAWPLITTMLYINQTGDLKFLLEQQTYFKDKHISRSCSIDTDWKSSGGNKLRQKDGEIYYGTILEHILLQNIIPFFNVGEHNNIRIEGADWNDALDMANDRGESVAFSALYANNLLELSRLVLKLKEELEIEKLELAKEVLILLDSINEPIEYKSIEVKKALLESYYNASSTGISSEKVLIETVNIANDLEKKATWLTMQIRNNEWIKDQEGYAWFNGYYDNNGQRVEGNFPSGVRMTLTGQVFTVMGQVATQEQVKEVIRAVNRYLKDPEIGYRLNSDFSEIQPSLGRAFGFAYGHKENGAMFSHMAVMYANALYKRGFAREGYKVMDFIYKLSTDFSKSRIYPGIPEYINQKGRGMYHYLTGAASWFLLTMLQEVYGVKGSYGALVLEPKLVKEQFCSQGEAAVETVFADRGLRIVYRNLGFKDYGHYRLGRVCIDGTFRELTADDKYVLIEKKDLIEMEQSHRHLIEVDLV